MCLPNARAPISLRNWKSFFRPSPSLALSARIRLQNHEYMVALYALWYNFVRIHKTLRTSPAMAAGIEKRLCSMEDVVALIDARSEKIGGETLVG